ncbi:MAG: sel1 repeat family protein [Nitrosomonadales bacterium]|nr:sel1 repeat family protein [Nitrosomonadales bacterium]
MYEKGQGVTQDYQQAVSWYSKAAKQKHVSAQLNLGFLYNNGLGGYPRRSAGCILVSKGGRAGGYAGAIHARHYVQ